jgi:hypothetical protein
MTLSVLESQLRGTQRELGESTAAQYRRGVGSSHIACMRHVCVRMRARLLAPVCEWVCACMCKRVPESVCVRAVCACATASEREGPSVCVRMRAGAVRVQQRGSVLGGLCSFVCGCVCPCPRSFVERACV